TGGFLAAKADEGSGESELRVIIGEDGCVEHGADFLPCLVADGVFELKFGCIDGDTHAERTFRREGDVVGQELADVSSVSGDDVEGSAEFLVVAETEVVVVFRVVVGDESGHLLECLRLEIKRGGGGDFESLDAARDETLAEGADRGLPAFESEETGALS